MLQNEIRIIEEEKDFLVVYKPYGLAMHNSTQDENNNDHLGFISLLREYYGAEDLYPVHRLDKVTSGVMIVAKGKSANQQISQLFQNRQVEKYYLAVSNRKPSKKQGAIMGDMEPGRNGSWKLSQKKHNPAITQFFSYGLGEGFRCFIVKPFTGKTHQIRVALKSLGSPILGDSRYGGSESDRTYLHAYQIGFELNDKQYTYCVKPADGEHYLSSAFNKVLEDVGDVAQLNWPKVKK